MRCVEWNVPEPHGSTTTTRKLFRPRTRLGRSTTLGIMRKWCNVWFSRLKTWSCGVRRCRASPCYCFHTASEVRAEEPERKPRARKAREVKCFSAWRFFLDNFYGCCETCSWKQMLKLSAPTHVLLISFGLGFCLPWAALVCSLELAFLLDSSESAMSYRFEKQKDFVLSFGARVMKMQVADWHLTPRLAALQYSSSVSIVQSFSEWRGLDVFLTSVGSMAYIGQGTYSSYAIGNATELFVRETDDKHVRVMLLMTDGSDHPRSPDILATTAEAKSHNIKLFAISLSARGSQNSAKMRAMASSPPQQFVHNLNDPDLEERLLQELVSRSYARLTISGEIISSRTAPCGRYRAELRLPPESWLVSKTKAYHRNPQVFLSKWKYI